ncbi:MAG: AMP-binding protein [Acidimicrobiia bacterium]|nr:AMP-binding protein [Acidimicrobiia bacterium]
MSDNLSVLFESVVDSRPHALALVRGDEQLSFAQLDGRANQIANRLKALGVAPGAHVGLHLNNQVHFFAAMLGCLKAGAVPLAFSTRLLASELADAIDFLDVEGIFTEGDHATVVADASMATAQLQFVVVFDELSEHRAINASNHVSEHDLAGEPTDRPTGTVRSAEDPFILVTAGVLDDPPDWFGSRPTSSMQRSALVTRPAPKGHFPKTHRSPIASPRLGRSS